MWPENEIMRERQMSLTHVQRQGFHILACPCSALIGWFISQSVEGGLNTVGWLKQITKEENVLASVSGHHSDGFIMEAMLLHPLLCHCCPSAVVHLPERTICWEVRDSTSETEMMFHLVVIALTSHDSNLWLLTCSGQRLTMHFCCVVYQGLSWLWHLFKAAFNYFLQLGPVEQVENQTRCNISFYGRYSPTVISISHI